MNFHYDYTASGKHPFYVLRNSREMLRNGHAVREEDDS